MLEVPPTIRLPNFDELPNNAEVHELLKKRETANIVEGFVIQSNTTHELPFKFYGEININNSRLWDLFVSLTDLLPLEASLVINHYEEDPHISNGANKTRILKSLEQFKNELTQDCSLEFGLLHHSELSLEEIFIAESKYLKVWTSQEFSFRQIMQSFGIEKTLNLNFIDEFPKVVEPLKMHNPSALSPEILIQELISSFP